MINVRVLLVRMKFREFGSVAREISVCGASDAFGMDLSDEIAANVSKRGGFGKSSESLAIRAKLCPETEIGNTNLPLPSWHSMQRFLAHSVAR